MATHWYTCIVYPVGGANEGFACRGLAMNWYPMRQAAELLRRDYGAKAGPALCRGREGHPRT